MDIQTTKSDFLKSNPETDNVNQIEDFWHQLSNPEKEEIINGIEELNQGKRISFEDFMKKI